MAPAIAQRGFLGIVRGVPPFRRARILSVLALGLAAAAARGSLWVSPDGDDANPGTEERPFRTLEKARDVVRTMNRNMVDDITVFIGGAYRLARPLELGPEDAASNGFSIVYTAAPGKHPVIGGGFRVTGWTLVDRSGNLWQAPAPDGLEQTRHLFVNGVPASRTRGRLLQAFSRDADEAPSNGPDSRAQWKNSSDVVFPETDPSAIWSEREGRPPFFVENAFELLGPPGQWYFDRGARKIYYTPRPGEDLGAADIEAASGEALVVGAGSPSRPLSGLIFKGIRFEYTSAAEADASARPAALRFSQAGSIQFLEDDFVHLGTAALALGPEFREGTLEGCLFAQVTGTALRLERARQVRVANCRFSYVSLTDSDGAAIGLDGSEGVTVEHVLIEHYPRHAILPQDALTGANSGRLNRITAPAIDYDGRTPEVDPREPERAEDGLAPDFAALREERTCEFGPPHAPSRVSAAPGDRVAYVTWDPPTVDGAAPVTAYLIASSHGARMKVPVGEFHELGYATFGGLENGHSVNFTVTAINANGTSPPSLATGNVVPKRNRKLKPPAPPHSAFVSTDFGEARIQIDPPPSDRGSPIIAYSFTPVPSGVRVVFEGWDVIHADSTHPIVRTIKGFPMGSGTTIAIAALNAAGEGKPALLKLQR